MQVKPLLGRSVRDFVRYTSKTKEEREKDRRIVSILQEREKTEDIQSVKERDGHG